MCLDRTLKSAQSRQETWLEVRTDSGLIVAKLFICSPLVEDREKSDDIGVFVVERVPSAVET